jgi:hypothetical protein
MIHESHAVHRRFTRERSTNEHYIYPPKNHDPAGQRDLSLGDSLGTRVRALPSPPIYGGGHREITYT